MNLPVWQFILGLSAIVATNTSLVAAVIFKIGKWMAKTDSNMERIEGKVDDVKANLTLAHELQIKNLQLQIDQLREQLRDLRSKT